MVTKGAHFVNFSPPKPVSASAMSGTLLSRLAIIPAFSLMSFKVAIPKSAMPSFDMVVPAPVFHSSQFKKIQEKVFAIRKPAREHTIYKQSKPAFSAILAVNPS